MSKILCKHKRVVDKMAIARVKADRCEICGAPTYGIDPHHIYTRGSGGGDLEENLIQLCFRCHYEKIPSGSYSKGFLMGFVSRRMGVPIDICEAKIRRAKGYDV